MKLISAAVAVPAAQFLLLHVLGLAVLTELWSKEAIAWEKTTPPLPFPSLLFYLSLLALTLAISFLFLNSFNYPQTCPHEPAHLLSSLSSLPPVAWGHVRPL